jgi:hypothetical protein
MTMENDVNRRQLTRLLLVAFALLANAVPARAETVLRVVMNSDLKIVDPIWSGAYVTRDHGYMIYDTLFATDANGEIRPQMVDRTEISSMRCLRARSTSSKRRLSTCIACSSATATSRC